MSALTDLFTAMANKIRSKTGGSDTYTPAEMVSDGIDDVYDAGVAAGTTPTQTKSVTAGTSQVTVTPDTGYALSSVTVDPTPSETKTEGPNVSTNKEVTPTSGKLLSKVTITPQTHTGTYTPAANTAANDMGANHDKRYVNTSGMIVPSGNKAITSNGTGIDVSSYATASVSVSGTSITPSNSSPASMSSGSLYTPSASGYAISSYSSVTPSNSSPVSLSSGSIYKMGGAGKAVASVTSVAPSNSSPATLTSGTVYKPSANGVAISSYSSITPSSSSQSVSSGSIYKMGGNGVVVDALPTITSITPSNSSPVSMSANSNYKPSANGYAIAGYQSVSPSESGTYFLSGMKNMGTSGYAYYPKPEIINSDPIFMTGNYKTQSGNNNAGLADPPIYGRSDFDNYFSAASAIYTAKKAFTAIFYIFQRAATNSANGCYFKLYKNGVAILESSTASTVGKAAYLEVQVASGDTFYVLQHATGTSEIVTTMVFEKT